MNGEERKGSGMENFKVLPLYLSHASYFTKAYLYTMFAKFL